MPDLDLNLIIGGAIAALTYFVVREWGIARVRERHWKKNGKDRRKNGNGAQIYDRLNELDVKMRAHHDATIDAVNGLSNRLSDLEGYVRAKFETKP